MTSGRASTCGAAPLLVGQRLSPAAVIDAPRGRPHRQGTAGVVLSCRAGDDHEINDAEWIIYDALYAYCQEMVGRGKVDGAFK